MQWQMKNIEKTGHHNSSISTAHLKHFQKMLTYATCTSLENAVLKVFIYV